MAEPKYQKIKNDLRQQIISGKFENGDKFYTEAELVDIYGVSSITVIRAIKELVSDGYLVRKQGKGTFISRARKGKLVEFSDMELFPIETDTVTVLSIQKGNDAEYLEKLGLPKTEYYYKIIRLRYADGSPYLYHQSYIPRYYILNPEADLQHFKSIYQRFKLDFNIHMSEEPFIETNQVVIPSPKPVQEALNLSPTEASILQIKKTQSSVTQSILEYTETYKHWKYYKFEIKANS
ncbi:GntR family transcriptional regulator [Streptococcus sp.]|nr:GntR family transcriptional regulator [Streptococcus sp.]MDY3824349.1 GntR family transcriptional regulator [Streptococcus sp.]